MAATIYGIQRAQAGMLRTINAVKPRNGLGAAVKAMTIAAHRYAMGVTHVDTGALKAAHTMQVSGARGQIYINPSAVRSDGQRPSVYGVHEHARGGSHAFYDRTIRERGQSILREGEQAFRRYLP